MPPLRGRWWPCGALRYRGFGRLRQRSGRGLDHVGPQAVEAFQDTRCSCISVIPSASGAIGPVTVWTCERTGARRSANGGFRFDLRAQPVVQVQEVLGHGSSAGSWEVIVDDGFDSGARPTGHDGYAV